MRKRLAAGMTAIIVMFTVGHTQERISVADVGFATPESVLHDGQGDVYLVSNINGEPLAEDGNGFISRLSPEGEVMELRWIDGETEGVELHAPKGMAIAGDTLYVADITVVRMFNRETGEATGFIEIQDSSFLNDVAAGPDGMIYVTDTGVDANFEPTGTDAIYRITPGGEVETVLASTELGNPNGLTVMDSGKVLAVTFGDPGQMYVVREGQQEDVQELSVAQLDGVEVLPDGDRLISSWGASAVVRVSPDGEVTPVVEDVNAPADIGYDAERNRLLIPLFMDNQVIIHELENLE